MQRIRDAKGLYYLLDKGLKEEVQFSARIDVKNSEETLFSYEGRVSLLPIQNQDRKYEMECHEGKAIFRFRKRENVDIDYRTYDCIIIPLDLSEEAFMRINQPTEIKY